MIGHKAQAEFSFDRGDFSEQFHKSNIAPVRVHVLTEHSDLFIPLRDEFLALFHDILRTTASFPPAHVRNDAVCAEIIAAVHDVYPCVRITRAEFRRAFRDRAFAFLNGDHALFRL